MDKKFYYSTNSLKQKNKRGETLIYLTQKEKNKLREEIGMGALLLFEFYLTKANTPDYNFEDVRVAKALEMSVRKVKELRLKLTKEGLFKKTIHTNQRLKSKSYVIRLGRVINIDAYGKETIGI
jgi:hypothetical protein